MSAVSTVSSPANTSSGAPARIAPILIPVLRTIGQRASRKDESKPILRLKEKIEDIEGLKDQPGAGEEDNGESQPIVRDRSERR